MRIVIATTNLDLNGECFAEGAFDQFKSEVPVTIGFNHNQIVGRATDLKFENGQWSVSVNLDLDTSYAVPGFRIVSREGNTITKAIIYSIGLINNPADQSLPKIGQYGQY